MRNAQLSCANADVKNKLKKKAMGIVFFKAKPMMAER